MTHLATFKPPFQDRSLAWLNVDQVAQIWNRTPRMIRRWCVDGTLVSMGARVYRDPLGRWHIGVSHSEVPETVVPTVVELLDT
jgi:hypothetical protein